ncbi:pol [Symbiodinium microadriaticum]|nr:pol [Symbiodinium microadriaticum]
MAPKRPRLEAEVAALPLLQRSAEIRKDEVLQVLEKIPKEEWTPKAGGHALTFGAFSRVTTSLRTTSRRYPMTTRVLTKYMSSIRNDLPFTAITVHRNVRHAPHVDSRNSVIPSFVVALTTGYTGGDLWLADPNGDVAIPHRGRMTPGRCFDIRVSERFRYEKWGARVYRQLRFVDERARWPEGILRSQQGRAIDLCSDGSGRELDDTVLLVSSSDSDTLSLCYGSAAPEPDLWDFELADEEEAMACTSDSQLLSAC